MQGDALTPSAHHRHVCFSHQERRWPERHLLCLHHDPGDAQVSQHGRCFLCCKDPPQLQAKYGRDLGKHQTLPALGPAAGPSASLCREERCWGMLTSPKTSFSIPNPDEHYGHPHAERVSVSVPAPCRGLGGQEDEAALESSLGLAFISPCRHARGISTGLVGNPSQE